MSNLISGKEALIALANGDEVEMMDSSVGMTWTELNELGFVDEKNGCSPSIHLFLKLDDAVKFRLKPRTITLNGIEVPAPFKPEIGDDYYILDQSEPHGFIKIASFSDSEMHRNLIQFGAWRTEEEIKQVVDALRKAFKGGVE